MTLTPRAGSPNAFRTGGFCPQTGEEATISSDGSQLPTIPCWTTTGRPGLRQAPGPCLAIVALLTLFAQFSDAESPSPGRGLELLQSKAFLPADFPEAAWDDVWQVWPPAERERARAAAPDERRRMALARYGLPPRDDAPGLPLGYVRDGRGGLSLTCLACHAGQVDGQTMLGLGNTRLAFETLGREIVRTRLMAGERLGPWELSRLTTPLGGSRGTTNAQIFSLYLVSMRDDEMCVRADYKPPPVLHHDLDAPPLWNTHRKQRLYIDGFAPKTPRTIMQFVLYPRVDAARLREYETDFEHVLAWIESLRPPAYSGPVEALKSTRGQLVFSKHCAECHGSYGPHSHYPERTVPIDVVGTDRRRLDGLTPEHRRRFSTGWLGYEGQQQAIERPEGYVAPPLDGLWASAPYFHNGACPTVWHVLHPEARPAVWRRASDAYDHARLGLTVTTFEDLPADVRTAAERLEFFDARLPGKSAAGHDFPAKLDEAERDDLLEYLKTL
jgi:mono/diheme cytochrome c family protein